MLGRLLKNIFGGGEKATDTEAKYPGPVSRAALEAIFQDCSDFENNTVYIGENEALPATVFFVDGLVSGEAVAREVIRPLTSKERFGEVKSLKQALDLLINGGVYSYTVKKREQMDDLVSDLVNGFCAVVFDALQLAVTFETKSNDKRGIDKPDVETTVKGAKDSFVEIYRTNTALIRKKLRDPNLKIVDRVVGSRSNTRVGILYLDNLTNDELVAEIIERISNVDIEGLLTTGDLEEYIIEKPSSPFPRIIETERPDKFCINLLEGRVGLLVDGLPFGLLLPVTFSELIKVPEDKSGHFLVASGLTLLRYISIILSLFLPAVYVAIAMYHQEMIPTKMMISIIESKKDVPFSTVAEVLGMLVVFEILQEAGLRLPQSIGQTVSIIGALVVGQSAVEANVISPVVVIVVALAGVAGYTMPNQDLASALRLCRFLFVLLSLALGMFGLVLGIILFVYHLSTLENYGVPYMSPFAGGTVKEIMRALLRFPMPKSRQHKLELRTKDEVKRK